MDYHVLGPMRVERDGVPLKLGGPRPLMVVAVLLSRVGQVVPQDALIDQVWSGDPPESARATLQSYIYGLRQALGREAIRRVGEGYQLVLDEDWVDAIAFTDAVADARARLPTHPAEAHELLVEALGMWTGSAYAGLEANGGLMAEAARLGEIRLLAVESRIEAAMALGDHAGVVSELESLVREHPLRERFRVLQMLALYRSGRQAEALEAYQRARATLAEDLGIDPSAALQEIHEQILEQDPSLTAPEPRPGADPRSELTDRSPSPALGSHALAGFELRGVLGEGAFGVVHRAYQPSVGREVAVKAIRPVHANRPAFVQLFEQEAQLVAQLEHPHILGLIDFWRGPEGAFLVMPLMRGGSLAASLTRGGWNMGPALRLLDEVGGALAHAHRHGVLHRDLKAANVLLDEEGHAYLSDFGIATRGGSSDGWPLEISRPLVAPEEALGQPATVRTDVFGLGVLAFELLTGVRPTTCPPLPLLSDARPGLPDDLDGVLARATATQPEDRFERVEDLLRALRQVVGADVVRVADGDSPATGRTPLRNPYKGLRAFREADARDFHGRDALVEKLLAAVARRTLVTVVGPSGSGKSSLVHAGLVPALRAGGLPGSGSWLVTDMFPGSYPFEELEAALLRVAVDRPESLRADLLDPRGLLRISKQILPDDDSTLLLVIDQFEELFSTVTSDTTRRLFIDNLLTVATDQRSRVRLVLTMRADFFDRPLAHAELAAALDQGLVTVGPPTADGMAQAIAAPARAAGLEVEPGLVGRIMADVQGQPGGLPLMQYALTELFGQRDGDMLTIDAYEAAGGVLGALGRRAEELYTGLAPPARAAAKQLFLRLVTVDEQAADTRRRARRADLQSLDVDGEALDLVLQQFGSFRLLSFDRDPVSRGPTVEVAHEALLSEWDRLAGWIEDQRDNLLVARRITTATREWVDGDRDDSFLLRGARLEQAEAYLAATPLSLTAEETTYLDASRVRQARAIRRERSRRRRTLGGLTAALTAVSVLAVFALVQRDVAAREAREARVRELAGESQLAVAEDPERAVLIALAAVDISEQAGEEPLPEALGALQMATQQIRLLARHPNPGHSLAVSPTGEWYTVADVEVTNSDHAGPIVVERASGAVTSLTGFSAPPSSVTTTADGDLVVGFSTSTVPGGPAAAVLDPRTGAAKMVLDGPDRHHHELDTSSDGRHLVATSCGRAEQGNCLGERLVTVWSLSTGEVVSSFAPTEVFDQARFLADGERLVVVSHDPPGLSVHALDGTQLNFTSLDLDQPVVSVHQPSDRIAVSGFGDTSGVRIYEVGSTDPSQEIPAHRPLTLAWNEDGTQLAFSGHEGTVFVADPSTGTVTHRLAGSETSTFSLGFVPGGQELLSSNADHVLRWDLSPTGPSALGAVSTHTGPQWGFDIAPDQDQIAAFTLPPGGFELIDADSGQVLAALEDQLVGLLVGIREPSPDLSLVGAMDADGRATIRRLPSLEVARDLEDCRNVAAFSPDNTLAVVSGWVCRLEDPPPGTATHAEVVDVEGGGVRLDLPHLWVYSAAFNPEGAFEGGRYLAITDQESVQLWDVQTGEVIGEMTPADNGLLGHLTVAFDPTGNHLAAGSVEGFVWVVDIAQVVAGATMAEAMVFGQVVHTGPAATPALAENGVLATGGFDGLVRTWDIHTGRMLVEFRTDVDEAAPVVAVTSDGGTVFYPDTDQVIRRHPTDPEELVATARAVLTRSLTPDECERHLGRPVCADA